MKRSFLPPASMTPQNRYIFSEHLIIFADLVFAIMLADRRGKPCVSEMSKHTHANPCLDTMRAVIRCLKVFDIQFSSDYRADIFCLHRFWHP